MAYVVKTSSKMYWTGPQETRKCRYPWSKSIRDAHRFETEESAEAFADEHVRFTDRRRDEIEVVKV